MSNTKKKKLENGMDSGAVPESVKRSVWVKSAGMCAWPDCDEKIVLDGTLIGECAHIIPRKVGETRENYITPLEERRKEENLLYLCKKHHQIVDKSSNAEALYSAEKLKQWKRDHEDFAASITKKSSHIPKEFRDMLANTLSDISSGIGEQKKIKEQVIDQLLNQSTELLHRQCLVEASALLTQAQAFLFEQSDALQQQRASLLNAMLSARNENITGAKAELMALIKKHPENLNAMHEYIELCDRAPSTSDEAARIFEIAQSIDSEHPRMTLIEYSRLYEKQDIPPLADVTNKLSEDARINARLKCQLSLFADYKKDIRLRDKLLDEWESELPSSPRPVLFRVMFKVADIFHNNDSRVEDSLEVRNYIQQAKVALSVKDPLSKHDKMSWVTQELKLELLHSKMTGKIGNEREKFESLIEAIETCYFDKTIDSVLSSILLELKLNPKDWKILVKKINESDTAPSTQLIELLFLHALPFEELKSDLQVFIKGSAQPELLAIITTLEKKEIEGLAKHLNNKESSIFTLIFLQSIEQPELEAKLIDLLNVEEEYKPDLLYAKLRALDNSGDGNRAAVLINQLCIDNAAPFALQTIERVAYDNSQWHLFVPAAERLLKCNITEGQRRLLCAQLCMAFHELGDDNNAVEYGKISLENPEEINPRNAHQVIYTLTKSYERLCEYDEGSKTISQFENYSFPFQLFIEQANLYLKSNIADKESLALQCLFKAFKNEITYTEKHYLAAVVVLVDLANAKSIPLRNEEQAQDGLYIKIDGFRDGWFYIGERNDSFCEQVIAPDSENYEAVINKELAQVVEWPADKFAKPNTTRNIIHILTPAAFLHQRAHEAMHSIASTGDAPIWSIQVIKEDGKLDKENLNKFCKEKTYADNGFFKMYVESAIPFAFLCKSAGGIAQAISRIGSENKGFIRCNDSTQKQIDEQHAAALEVINGKPGHLDGLSALMLAESGLTQQVFDSIPNLYASTSVIRTLREVATNFVTSGSSPGRGVFVNGNFEFRPKDSNAENRLRERLLSAASILNNSSNKILSGSYIRSENPKSLENLLPDYFVDPYKFAQDKKGFEGIVITDDPLFVKAFELSEGSKVPKTCSSLSIIRVLAEKGVIQWRDYAKFFGLLSSYRYHLLPLSVDDITKLIMPQSAAGIILPSINNLKYLNLGFTLSEEYGVQDDNFLSIVSGVLISVIKNDALPIEVADEIFSILIVESLHGKDKQPFAEALVQICKYNMTKNRWASSRGKQKLLILEKQLKQYIEQYDSYILNAPLLLKVCGPLKENQKSVVR